MIINHSELRKYFANELIQDEAQNSDFSSDAGNPIQTMSDSKLNSHSDRKSLFQILVDFLKSIFPSHNVQAIPCGGMASEEENERADKFVPAM